MMTLDQKRKALEMMGFAYQPGEAFPLHEWCPGLRIHVRNFDPATNPDHWSLAMDRLKIDIMHDTASGVPVVWATAGEEDNPVERVAATIGLAVEACLIAMAELWDADTGKLAAEVLRKVEKEIPDPNA